MSRGLCGLSLEAEVGILNYHLNGRWVSARYNYYKDSVRLTSYEPEYNKLMDATEYKDVVLKYVNDMPNEWVVKQALRTRELITTGASRT